MRNKGMFLLGATLVGSMFALGFAAPAADNLTISDASACAALAGQSFGNDVTLTSATHIEAAPAQLGQVPMGFGAMPALPSYCRIEGVINQREGEGGSYGIGFALALPDQWTGRFLLQGGGGLNGSVGQPIGPVGAGDRPALARGFAVISHDSGHKGAGFDSSFMQDQRAALDFAEASVRTVALLGKAITSRYYGTQISHSYMTGCSTGGREGMLASQRYPELFDGIIVGAPAMRTGDSNLGIEYTQVLLNQLAPRNAGGVPDVGQLLTPAIRQTILDGMLDQCDALDGLSDGMIENVGQCNFQPSRLACRAGQRKDCISPGLAAALQQSFAGPFDAAGYPIYVPVPFDTGIVATQGGYLPTGAPGPLGPASTATSIALDARIHEIRNDATQRLTDTNYWTDLNTFLDRGGKMIFYHGVSDFWFSPWATWDWYERAEDTNGAAFSEASRFYMVPGMMHCSGGNAFDRFDMLGPLVDWVEHSQAPQEIVARRREPAEESRPLCPYPRYAAFKGGDPALAASFSCEMPD